MLIMLLGFIRENLRKIHKFDTVVLLLGGGSTSGYPAPKKTTEMFRINLWALGSSFLTHAQF